MTNGTAYRSRVRASLWGAAAGLVMVATFAIIDMTTDLVAFVGIGIGVVLTATNAIAAIVWAARARRLDDAAADEADPGRH